MKATWAQAGEDLVLRRIFDLIGDGNKTCVDFGAADGVWLSNTKLFRNAGWRSWLFDIEPKDPQWIRAVVYNPDPRAWSGLSPTGEHNRRLYLALAESLDQRV